MTNSGALRSIDWYNIPIDQVFYKLGCSRGGLTSMAVRERLRLFGLNNYQHHNKVASLLKFLRSMWNPQMVATIIAIANRRDKFPKRPAVSFIFILFPFMASVLRLIIDYVIYYHITTLMAPLARKVKVLRDGKWSEEYSSKLVPGDVIGFEAGDTIPADARLLGGELLLIDESVLTGRDSSQVIKRPGDAVYSGCICEQGASEAVIVATGGRTSFRNKLCTPGEVKRLEKVLAGIWNVCICLVAVGILVEIIVMYPFQHRAFRAGIDNLLVILIGAIPITLHTDALVIIYNGFQILARKGAILKSVTAVKEIADMDVLCTDTAGNLTSNELTADQNLVDLGIDVKMITESIYEIVEQLQAREFVCGMTGNGVCDVPALKKADIGIAMENATDAARKASGIVLTKPGLSVIIQAVLICREISHKIKEYCIRTIASTAHIIVVFMMLTFIWKFDFPPLKMLLIVYFNQGLSFTYSIYEVKRSLVVPNRWGLLEILKPGVAIGVYLALTTICFFWTAFETDFFQRVFGVASLMEAAHSDNIKLEAAVYLQVSISVYSLVFVTQSRRWSSKICDGVLMILMFHGVQLVFYIGLCLIQRIGWGWAGVIWLYNIISYILLLTIRCLIQYAMVHVPALEVLILFVRKKRVMLSDLSEL